jgi:hypothetical protein
VLGLAIVGMAKRSCRSRSRTRGVEPTCSALHLSMCHS